jgi:hypothetical protein
MLLADDDRRIPIDAEQLLAHHSLRKCLFDFRYNKSDIKYTSVRPKLCESCFENLKSNGVPVDILYSVREELKGLQKDPYYKLTGFFKKHPVLSIILTTLVSFLLNVLCNIIC